MTVLKFPRRVCVSCGRRATIAMELADEYGRHIGHKDMCEEYPFCEEDVTDEYRKVRLRDPDGPRHGLGRLAGFLARLGSMIRRALQPRPDGPHRSF